MSKYFTASFTLSVMVCSLPALGQVTSEISDDKKIYFSADLGLGVKQVENANKTSLAEDEISEMQIRSELSFAGAYYGDLISEIRADYDIFHVSYGEDSQEDDSSIIGKSSLLFGGNESLYDLGVSHSSTVLLVDPEESDLTGNRDDRTISTIFAALRTVPERANIFSLGGSFTDVAYKEFDVNDSTRDALYLSYTRNISALSSSGVMFSATRTDFDFSDAADYEYKRGTVFFSRALRRLNYSIFAGQYYVESKETGDENDGLYGKIDIDYRVGGTSFFINAERDITDTSSGDSNSTLFSSDVGIDGRIGEQDQILRKYINAGVSFGLLCESCVVRMIIGGEDEAFLSLTNENSKSKFFNIFASYEPLRTLTLAVNAKYTDFSYSMREEPNQYEDIVLRASASLAEVSRNLSAEFFIEFLERQNDLDGGYNSSSFGMSVSYQLY